MEHVNTKNWQAEQAQSSSRVASLFRSVALTTAMLLASCDGDHPAAQQRPLLDPQGNHVITPDGKTIWTYPVLGADGKPAKDTKGNIIFKTPEEGGVKPKEAPPTKTNPFS